MSIDYQSHVWKVFDDACNQPAPFDSHLWHVPRKENESFDRASLAIAPHRGILTHSMQLLNTSVPSNVNVRLIFGEKRKPSHPSARFRKSAGSATRRTKANGHFHHAKSLKKRIVEEENLIQAYDP